MKVPVFPLHTVICPTGRLPLQVFEQRYLTMLSQCMRQGRGFVVVQIQDGSEVGECQFFEVGTYVEVVDFEQLPNGLLGVTVEGRQKVRLLESSRQDDGLYVSQLDWLPPEEPAATPEEYRDLVELLQELRKHPMISALGVSVDVSSACELGWRLTEWLPLTVEDRQELLGMHAPLERLRKLRWLLRSLEDN